MLASRQALPYRDRNVADVRALVGSGMAQPPAAARATSASFVAPRWWRWDAGL